MFSFFKRPVAKPDRAGAKPAPRQDAAARTDAAELPEDLSLPEVVEGNEHTDWALWEDSVNALDSQMQNLTPTARIYERDKQTPSELQDIDPFSRIGRKSR